MFRLLLTSGFALARIESDSAVPLIALHAPCVAGWPQLMRNMRQACVNRLALGVCDGLAFFHGRKSICKTAICVCLKDRTIRFPAFVRMSGARAAVEPGRGRTVSSGPEVLSEGAVAARDNLFVRGQVQRALLKGVSVNSRFIMYG